MREPLPPRGALPMAGHGACGPQTLRASPADSAPPGSAPRPASSCDLVGSCWPSVTVSSAFASALQMPGPDLAACPVTL